jgi:hypothetical protein
MKKILPFLLLCLFIAAVIKAQQKPNTVLPDVNKLMKMTPAELEAYKKQMLNQASKQAKEVARQGNIKLDESMLPDYELQLPEKDLKRIAAIPAGIPTRAQLITTLKNTKQQLEAATSKDILKGVKKLVASQNPAQLQSSSIAHWYADKPVAAVLLSMESALKNPDTAIAWNNLTALFNMCKLESKSVPILKHWLEKLPQSSLLLNNMGQAWLGLGDIPTAESYLKKCLAVDSLNPEANRSMALICAKRNEQEKAKEYVKKEQQITQRESTLKQVEKITENRVNLYFIYLKNPRIPKEKFFESIGLDKFVLPQMPYSTGEVDECKNNWASFSASVSAELFYWYSAAATPASEEEKKHERYENAGIYSKKAERLYEDLKDSVRDRLPLFNDLDMNLLLRMANEFAYKYSTACPDPSTYRDYEVWKTKCCAIMKPIADMYMSENNTFVKSRALRAMTDWKEFINGVINIYQLDPTPAHKRFISGLIANYFSMLGQVAGSVRFEYPDECRNLLYNEKQADSALKSSREINMNCPSWLNIELDLQVARLKADCEKFTLEGGKGIIGEYEKNFKTGTSTLAAGVGVRQNIAGVIEGELKQLVYITFDNNNSFVDFGFKGNAELSLGGNPIKIAEGIAEVGGKVAGAEGGYTLGINSGIHTTLQGKGFIAEFINISW